METVSEQKKIADSILKIFCLSILWMGIGLVTMPIFYPLLGISKGIDESTIGMILAIPPIVMMITVPFIRSYVQSIGIELSICVAALLFGLAFVAIGLTEIINDFNKLVLITVISQIMIGFGAATNIVGE